MSKVKEFQVQDGFKIHEFLLKVEADYLFSKNKEDSFYKLLNTAEFGKINKADIDKLIETGSKVIVINNDTLTMQAYNIDEDVLMTSLLGMSR